MVLKTNYILSVGYMRAATGFVDDYETYLKVYGGPAEEQITEVVVWKFKVQR